jgi:hypoxanthine-DNA glycosylase
MSLVHPNQLIRKRSFDPVVDGNTRLIVLGSLPGDKSLAAQEYYGNRQNKFWTLMSSVIGIELVSLEYGARLQSLLEHSVGLWDVVAEAHRPGSLDSNIQDRQNNDLLGLLARFPSIQAIAFNGGTAAKIGMKVLGEKLSQFEVVILPSSSPAYTLAYSEKLAKWKLLVHVLERL